MSELKVLELDASSYERHLLHADERVWLEKNCYIDIWIEQIHALGCEPLAILPCVSAIDFLDDQWTFFKPPHGELYDLYGIDVQELNCWRGLLAHAEEHLAAGRLVSSESDAWWLPDTSGTDYRTQHTKSSIIINALDVAARRMGYFHNAGYFELEGEDFARTFRLDEPHDPAFMPLYAELISIDRVKQLDIDTLKQQSRQLLAKHVARMPTDNPVERFATRFRHDLPAMLEQGLDHYHVWAFATVRQLGAAAELAELHLEWLDDPTLAPAVDAWREISIGAKTFILKAARAVNRKRDFDADDSFAAWAEAWDTAHTTLANELAA